MPKRFPEEFKRDVVAVARRRQVPLREIAADFGFGESTVQRWLHQADVDDGINEGPTTAKQLASRAGTSGGSRWKSRSRNGRPHFAKDAAPK